MSSREIYDGMDGVTTKTFKFRERSDEGFKKYGTTLHEERTTKMKGLIKYLVDIQEELMDAILYIQTAQEELKDQLDEKENHE